MATDRSADSSTPMSPRSEIRADKDLVRAAAQQLRHNATQGTYRGLRFPEHAYALASALDFAELRWTDQDEQMREELRRCCRVLTGTEEADPSTR